MKTIKNQAQSLVFEAITLLKDKEDESPNQVKEDKVAARAKLKAAVKLLSIL